MLEKTLSELAAERPAAFATGPFGSAVSSRNFRDSGIPMIRGTNLSTLVGCRLDEREMVFVDESFRESYARSIAHAGDLVFTCWGTIGQIGLIDARATYTEYLVSNKQMRMTPDPERVHPLFLYYYLSQESMIAAVQDAAIGSSVPGFNLGQLKKLKVSIPGLSIQRAIAGVLGALDDKIAANATTVAAAQTLMLAVVQGATGRASLGTLAGRRTTSVKPESLEARVDHFSLPAFDNGVLPEQAARDSVKSNKFVLRGPSVLISKLNPRIPRIWDVPVLSSYMSVASTEFVVLEPDGCSTSALWAAISQPEFSTQLQGKVAGTSGSHQRVRPAEMLTIDVLDPRTLASTDRALLDDLGRSVALVRAESARLAATRDELLPLLMSDRITVSEVEEVAEAVT
jgi:type I restriction enzyme S subunit